MASRLAQSGGEGEQQTAYKILHHCIKQQQQQRPVCRRRISSETSADRYSHQQEIKVLTKNLML